MAVHLPEEILQHICLHLRLDSGLSDHSNRSEYSRHISEQQVTNRTNLRALCNLSQANRVFHRIVQPIMLHTIDTSLLDGIQIAKLLSLLSKDAEAAGLVRLIDGSAQRSPIGGTQDTADIYVQDDLSDDTCADADFEFSEETTEGETVAQDFDVDMWSDELYPDDSSDYAAEDRSEYSSDGDPEGFGSDLEHDLGDPRTDYINSGLTVPPGVRSPLIRDLVRQRLLGAPQPQDSQILFLEGFMNASIGNYTVDNARILQLIILAFTCPRLEMLSMSFEILESVANMLREQAALRERGNLRSSYLKKPPSVVHVKIDSVDFLENWHGMLRYCSSLESLTASITQAAGDPRTYCYNRERRQDYLEIVLRGRQT